MVQAQPQLWGTPRCVAQHPLPTHSHAQPQPPLSVPCRAGLRVLLLPQRQGFSGLWVGAGCAQPRGSLRLVPGVCPGWCLGSRPCLLSLHSQWADPSMGTLTWSLHWASRAGGWWSDASFGEVDGVFPSSARSSGKLCNDSGRQPALLASCAWPEWLLLLPTRTSAARMSGDACLRRQSPLPPPPGHGGDPTEGVRSAWAAGAAWTLPIPPCPLSSGVCGHTQPTGL